MRIRLSWIFLSLLAVVYLISSSAWETRFSFVAEGLFVLGLILAGIGAMGRLWCSSYIAGHKNATLITEGPYSLCRNPLYFFSFIGCVGAGLATETITIPLIMIIAFAAYYPFVIRREEEYLAGVYGAQFATYKATVPRFFPRLSSFVEKDSGTVHLKVFRTHILSAIWFVWFPAFTEIVELLHNQNWLPTFIALY